MSPLGFSGADFDGNRQSLHFRIGVVPVTLETAIRKLQQEYLSFYARYRVDSPENDTLVLRIKKTPLWQLGRPRYEITGKDNDAGLFPARERELLAHLEWAINWQIALYFKKYLQIHASAVQVNGKTILFPGSPGSGKTTLCAGLVIKRARYFSDEFALLNPTTLQAYPYPKALCIKEASIKVLEEFCPHVKFDRRWIKKTKGVVAFLDPWEIYDNPIAQPAQVDFVIFPTYSGNTAPELSPLSKAEMVFNLNKHALNFLDFREQGIDTLADIASSASGFRLQVGNLEHTCELILKLVGNDIQKTSAT